MPTVFRSGPYRFFFYSGDGVEPPHVHVERDDKIAKSWLRPVRLQESDRFKSSGNRPTVSLTHLGRNLGGNARVKHQIKAVDRLLGNEHLHRERVGIYRAIAQTLLRGIEQPVIAVDWSDFQLGRSCVM